MEASYSDLIGDVKDSFDVGIFETNTLNIGYERAKEVVEQQLFRLLDQCFWDFPCLNTDLIQKTIGELNSFLNLHKIEQDSQLIEYINKHLHQAIQEYPWNEIIYKSCLKRWNVLVSGLENSKPSDLHPKIDDLVTSYYTILNKLLLILNDQLLASHLHLKLFPSVASFEPCFQETLKELKNQTTRLKIQLKLCPGVEPPQVKRVQRQTYRIVKKPYTEWNTYSIQETIEIEKEPSCMMVPLLHRILNYTSETNVQVVSYVAPTGWEATRVTAFVVDGNFKTAVVKRTVCKESTAYAEVEITYPRVTREHIWCKVQLEGVLSRKRMEEIKVPEFTSVIVTVDEDGEHELPEEFLDDIE